MLLLIEPINKKASPYIDILDKRDLTLDRRNLVSTDEAAKMLDRNEDIKILDVSYLTPKNKYTISSQSKLEITSLQSRFKVIQFNDGKKGQANELMDNKNTIAYIANILIEQENNCFPFKKNIKYSQAKFTQTSKISKKSMSMLFNNPDLIPM